MHILLTDILTCPRCGPEFGLIVLADRIEDRWVREGRLGCANCRASYVVARGVADLRHGEALGLTEDEGDAKGEGEDRAFRAAALVGAQPANATLLLIDLEGIHASGFANTHSEVHVIAASAVPPRHTEEAGGILSRLVAGDRLPFRDIAFQGAALLGTPSPHLILEIGRVLRKSARLVVDRAGQTTSETLRHVGFEVQLEQEGIVVAAAPGHG